MAKKTIEDVLDKLSPECRAKTINAMAKYGNNKWWRYDDIRVAAFYQLFEDAVLIDLKTYIVGLGYLLGRSVFTNEAYNKPDKIKKEALEAFERIKKQ